MAINDAARAERRNDNAYTLATWPLSIGVTPTGFLAAYLNHATGASLAVLGLISTVARIYDVVFNPLIGVISDRTRSRIGRRKPWVLAGYLGMIALLSLGILILPGENGRFSALWFAVGLMLFFSAMTTQTVPYQAQAGELTTDYDRRSRMNIRQGTIHIAANLLSYGVPYLLVDPDTSTLRAGIAHLLPDIPLFATPIAWLTTTALKGVANYGRVMIVLAWITILTSPVILWRYMVYTRDLPIPAVDTRSRTRAAALLLPMRNRMFMTFALGYFIFIAGYIGRLSLYPFIVPYATGGGYSFLLLMLVQCVSSIVATPLWTRIADRLERGEVMMIACVIEAAGLVCLGLSVAGGPYAALIGAALIGLPGGTVMMLPYLIASEAADYSQLRHGGDSRGLHVSLISMVGKIGSFLATLGLAAAGALGFNPKAGVSPHDVIVIQMLGLYVPAALIVVGGGIMMLFPITRRRHGIISRRIERRSLVLAGIPAAIAAEGV